MLYSHLQIHAHVYIYMLDTYRRNEQQTREVFFTNMYLSLYCKGSKRVTQCLRVRGSWRPNRNCNILTPLLWPSALCLSRSPDAQPEARRSTLLGDGFLYCILSASSLDPNSIWGPEGPFSLAWLSLPHLVYNSVRSLIATLTSVLTELYNSSTPTQSPTRSLEWHD